jgi:hypothetical protein
MIRPHEARDLGVVARQRRALGLELRDEIDVSAGA